MKAKDLQAEARAKGFRPVSVDVALFGRMTTSEAFRDVEAACQVAHALSTHRVDHEFDYFTACG
jgi:CRISPR system Cascade subunit CasC